MIMRAKERIVYAGLALFTIWPGVHIWLVKQYGIDPWKLGGWGMYAAPRIKMSGLQVYTRTRGGSGFVYLPELPPEVHPAAGEFLARYRFLRRLVRPDRLCREMMQRDPTIERLRIVVDQPVVDRDSGMVVSEEMTFECPE